MRRYRMTAVVLAVILVSGCSSSESNISIQPADKTTEVVVTTVEASGEGNVEQEPSEAQEESLEEKISSMEEVLASKEESLAEMEESLQEVLSSLEESAAESAAAGEEAYGSEDDDENAAGEETEEETTIAYEALVESADAYVRTEVTYTGRVVQCVALDDEKMQILIAVDDNDSTQLVGEYAKTLTAETIEHGDIVKLKGIFDGVNRYMTGNGERVDLPMLEVTELEVEEIAETESASVEEETIATESGAGAFEETSAAQVETSAAETSAAETVVEEATITAKTGPLD